MKYLLTLPEHLEHRITTIRESRDLNEISLEKLYGVLKTYELEQAQTKQYFPFRFKLFIKLLSLINTSEIPSPG